MSAALLCLVVALTAPAAEASNHRSKVLRSEFQRTHPCPSNGHRRGACPGYVIDHVVPLCAGGWDHPDNMQWQTVADAKAKDIEERQQCRQHKKGKR